MEITNTAKSTSKIKRISPAGKSTTYDFTVKDTHRILANGFYTSNCSHPEIETFIDIKRDLKKVTGANISIRFTDEFMQAVENNSEFTLRWPVEKSVEDAEITKVINAKQIWNKFIDAAWTSAEPGALFWDTIIKNGIPDCYQDIGYKTISTNPCVTGDTEVMVADGRGFVDIKTLADEGLDVPVFACDEKGKIVIKTMRNPRVTGKNAQVYRVTVEGGHTFRATGNHKMIMRDGSEREVKDLVSGDSLWISHHVSGKFNEALPGLRATTSQDYSWIRNGGSKTWKSAHRIIWEHFNSKKIGKNEVIHHVDFNSLNNRADNLLLMSKEDHDRYHADLIRGKNNPIFKIKSNAKRFAEYSKKMSQSVSGMNNPRAYNITTPEIINAIAKLTLSLGRRVTGSDWRSYAQENDCPSFLNDFRLGEKSFAETCYEIAISCGVSTDICNLDPRTARRVLRAESNGYRWMMTDSALQVEKTCEWCKINFWTNYDNREVSFCGHSCSNMYANRRAGKNQKRINSLREMHVSNGEKKRIAQLNVFTSLRSNLSRVPLLKEWEAACKETGCSTRLKTENGFSSWSDLKNSAESFNHRIISVAVDGNEDVYNGTVDDVHTFCFRVGKESIDNFKNEADLILASRQCGEIALSPYDSCRLMVINLTSFVLNPFTDCAKFDFPRFRSVAYKAQRLMDDLVDLEVECVDRILAKIDSDPQPDHVKKIEKDLWIKIKATGLNGRRTGLGITGLGDAIAAMNVRYGSDFSISMTKDIYKELAIGAHCSSLILATERGAFPVFNYEKEKDHVYLNKIMELCGPDMVDMWKKTGRRNIALTTTAPVGSVSCLTRTTSGIEPSFLLSYKRRRKITQGDIQSRADYVDPMGDKWQEYNVYHHWFKKWMNVTGKVDPQESPYWGATANDIDWEKSVDIQAAAQQWVDHSISKTCNLPNSATRETVNAVYMRAWKSGCKGFTVYRDGCRAGVLVTTDAPAIEQKKIEDSRLAPKRTKSLPCDIHRASIRNGEKSESWLVLVGLLDGKPYEVFCGMPENIEIPKKFKSGTLVKNGKRDGIATYNFFVPTGVTEDESIIFKDVVNLFDNPTQGAFTRTISLALRHNVPIQYVVEQLQKDKNSDMFSYARVIARVLKGYITDGTKSAEKGCPQCGHADLIYQESCLRCPSCGFSKCQ